MWLEKDFIHAYDAHADSIFRYCYYRVYDRERARDLMQETFTRAWKQIVDGKDIRNPRAFLFTVARNLVIDESHKKKNESLEALSEKGFDVRDPHVVDHHTNLEVENALTKLTELDASYREVVILRYVEGLGPKEIATITGESTNVIYVRIHRALKKLKQVLNDHEK